MKKEFPKKMENGGEVRRIPKGCGKVMNNRRKKTIVFYPVKSNVLNLFIFSL